MTGIYARTGRPCEVCGRPIYQGQTVAYDDRHEFMCPRHLDGGREDTRVVCETCGCLKPSGCEGVAA
jgi:hypothetical protein